MKKFRMWKETAVGVFLRYYAGIFLNEWENHENAVSPQTEIWTLDRPVQSNDFRVGTIYKSHATLWREF
jgi:hypothetical protein